jgi:lipopolysaccharide transport system ATP-binding protein
MENDIILKVENLSKQYRLGTISTKTISHDLNRFIAKIRGKEDPFLKIGESNDRSKKGESEYVWALKDINFEVKRGEVLGIIGKNGAGKSTLLKILSKVTSPTQGSIKSKGRIASLLEVGTGFHPEMTGKENIFLNGAILGMTKKEISNKLEEIVNFSGCERYIDTPVKRYSSGMKVRLAFAVAAFLEPDVLVVDEVLAVGDAEFQKKAIGKMQDISNTDGRTVLFVSHDMAAVKTLCKKSLLLEDGKVKEIGLTKTIIEKYISKALKVDIVEDKGVLKISSPKVSINAEKLFFNLKLEFIKKLNLNNKLYLDFAIVNNQDEVIVHYIDTKINEGKTLNNSSSELQIEILNHNLILGEYTFTLYFYDRFDDVLLWVEKFSPFLVEEHITNYGVDYFNRIKSLTMPSIEAKIH